MRPYERFLEFEACGRAVRDDDLERVPADLVEHVKHIDPWRIGDTAMSVDCLGDEQGLDVTVVWEEEEQSLYVRDDLLVCVEFIEALLKEIMRKFDHPKAVDVEWRDRPFQDARSHLAGKCTVTKDRTRFWTESELRNAERAITRL